MESDELPFSLRTALAMDEIAQNVMPNSWVGHGRIAVIESEELSINQKTKALEAVEKFAEQKPELSGEQYAEAVIPHIKTRFD